MTTPQPRPFNPVGCTDDSFSPSKLKELKEQWDYDKTKLRMYVLVRRDVLTLVQCGVQAGHAASEYVHFHRNDKTKQWAEADKTLIFLSATGDEIEKMKRQFDRKNKTYQSFHEPDLNDLQTAVAFEPVQFTQGKELFGQFALLK